VTTLTHEPVHPITATDFEPRRYGDVENANRFPAWTSRNGAPHVAPNGCS
jgi:hypothetical protein